MASSGMARHVALVRRATRRNIPEDTILYSHRRENLKSYIIFPCLIYRKKVTGPNLRKRIPMYGGVVSYKRK
jgi:hypothetical protein